MTAFMDRKGFDPAWLPACRGIGAQASVWANRDDLIAYVGKDGGQGIAPALFIFAKAEIEVNSTVAFGKGVKPRMVGDFTDRNVQFEWPVASGAVMHEAMHAAHTSWNREEAARQCTSIEFDALDCLEETRIEARGILEYPKNREFLRSSATKIVVGSMTNSFAKALGQVRTAARSASLSLARVDAGVLDDKDVQAQRELIEQTIPEDILRQLRGIWVEFQSLRDGNLTHMIELAKEWTAIVHDLCEERGEPEVNPNPKIIFMDGPAPQGTAHGDPDEADDGEMPDVILVYKDAAEQDGEGAEINSGTNLGRQQKDEKDEEDQKKREAERREQKDAERAADQVFGQEPKNVPQNGQPNPDYYTGRNQTGSRLIKTRPASAQERAAAVQISEDLDRARYRDRVQIEHNTVMPPGRLRTRSAVQESAQHDRGIYTPVEVFRRTDRMHVDDPILKLGMLTDISGSMSGAMEPMAIANWVMAEAARRIQGVAASVYYGASVFPVLKPYKQLDQVQIYSAPDGQHAFSTAFQALDGALGLLSGTGARLVIVCSDGVYDGNENANAVKWLNRCREEGVAVVWLGFDQPGQDPAEEYCRETGATHVCVGSDLMKTVTVIGQACERALTEAGAQS